MNRTTRFLAWHSSVSSVQAGHNSPHGTANLIRFVRNALAYQKIFDPLRLP